MGPKLSKHFTASGFVLHPDRKILLVHHRKLAVWLYPGGHVEPTETPNQAVLREILEETGVEAQILGDIDAELADSNAGVTVLHSPYRMLCEFINDPKDPHYHIDLIYLCKALTSDCVINPEVHDARFFSELETRELPLFPNFRVLLGKIFSNDKIWQSLGSRTIDSDGRTT